MNPKNFDWKGSGYFLGMLLSLIGLESCMVGPDYKRPSAPEAKTYQEASPQDQNHSATNPIGWRAAHPQEGSQRGAWWEIYHDPELNALEEKVAISNQNVLSFEALYREARGSVKEAKSALFPTVSTAPSLTRSGTGNSGVTHGQYQLPVDVSYVVDIWGSVRRSIEQNTASAQASFANLENAKLSYQTELAQDYFALHGLDAEKEILDTTLQSYDKYLTLTKNRYASGIASRGDVALAQSQLDATKVQQINLEVQRSAYEHAVAVLTGRPPSGFTLPRISLHALPPSVPPGVPSDLLERRPDIAAAERTMAASNAGIGIAVAAYYPALTLSGSTGYSSVSLSNLFSASNFFWSVGPALAETVFAGGKRDAVVIQARAAYEANVATYRQTVLTAFQQVEDNLAALRVLEDEAAAEETAIGSAQESLKVQTDQYKAGITTALDVITAQAAVLTAQLNSVTIQMSRMNDSVLLVEALGGGWDTSSLPTPGEVSKVPARPASTSN